MKSEPRVLHIETPFLESPVLTELIGLPTYLKMDSMQPSGSFKMRGIGNLITQTVKAGATHVVCASGGNAGMATAVAGRLLNIPVTIVIPSTVPKLFITKLKMEGANVTIHGTNWNESNEKALEIAKDINTTYIHPFDHPLVWEGSESLAEEILNSCSQEPSCIVLSVGGGGLLCGVLQCLQKHGRNIPIIAMETEGAHSFRAALQAGKPVSIGEITSIAKTLGALSVTPRIFELLPNSTVISEVVHDREAVKACIKFANDSRVLVEPSCGATLAAGYSGIIKKLIGEGKIKKEGCVVFVVCGGNGVTIDLLHEWENMFSINSDELL